MTTLPPTFREWLEETIKSLTEVADINIESLYVDIPNLSFYQNTAPVYHQYRDEIWRRAEQGSGLSLQVYSEEYFMHFMVRWMAQQVAAEILAERSATV